MNLALFLVPAGAVVALALWSWALHLRQQARLEALEGRVANLLAALSLLTDTTEGALRDITAEVTRLSGPAARPARARTTTARRVGGAARRGQSVQQIAAAEQISEGEVKLHLSLTERQGGLHAEMR